MPARSVFINYLIEYKIRNYEVKNYYTRVRCIGNKPDKLQQR